MISDEQILYVRGLLKPTTSLKELALAAGMSKQTLRKYLSLGKLPSECRIPHVWRTRHDPFEDVWQRIVAELKQNPTASPAILFRSLQAVRPGQFSEGQLRTLQRKIRSWKEAHHDNDDVRCNNESARRWMLEVLSGNRPPQPQAQDSNSLQRPDIIEYLKSDRLSDRKKVVTILARLEGIPNRVIADCLGLDPHTSQRYYVLYSENDIAGLFARERRGITKKRDNQPYIDALFATLHTPPSAYGINRTSWKMDDLHRVLAEKGCGMSRQTIRAIVRKAGCKWRRARRVLTSKDPEYKQKLERITSILKGLGPKDRFFSIDEYGPFYITQKPGRKLVVPGEERTVPQHQKARGRLIVTAALELSTNQVTHFYSDKKNTSEMIRLLEVLLKEYSEMEVLYLSWDAASWHLSKRFFQRVEEHNALQATQPGLPRIELAPLPSGAQFLNVIESVFSGMAKAIIHNSDYQTPEEAMCAIDRYFSERNAYFRLNPRRAGKKIWGKERVEPAFSESNNCKDPRWR
jgi:transposase